VLAAIGPKVVTEGLNLNFGVSASDPDLTTPTLTAEDVPTNATFLDNGNGTGTFNFNPDFTQAGVYNVRFIASDGALADTEIVAVTVNDAGNQAPVLAAIGSKVVTEGLNLNFGVSASDPDLTIPALTAENVPLNATFIDNGNGTGTFNFNPDFTQSGIYNVRFIASDGALADTEIVAVTVNDAGNQAPVLATIGPRLVTEGLNLNFGVSASDPDLTTPSMTAENVPTNATFLDNGNGTGTFNFNPDFTQAGIYNVRFIASDGALADTEIVAVTVNDAGNQAPVLATIGPRLVTEGLNLNFGVSASDPDLTTPTLTAEDVPTNATFLDNGNGTGTFNFNPDFTQSGIYNVRFIASDGALADTEIVAITVNDAGNQAPVLAAIGPKIVTEGLNLNFGVSASDPDLTTPSLTAESVPLNATFLDNGSGTGTFNFNPDFTQAGVYNVRFIASDGALADTEIVAVTVNDAGNQAPVLATIGPRLVTEGLNLNFGVSASDPDLTTPSLTAENVPTNATFIDNGNGTGTFNFNPDFTQSGIYNVRFIASDGALADTEIVAVTVNDAGNQAPILAAIGPQLVTEGLNLNFGVSATDVDGTTPVLTAEDIPLNATFIDIGNGTGTFNFNPDFAQAGSYNVRFIASDGALADTEMVTVTVNDAGNHPPVLNPIGELTINILDTLSVIVSSSDIDGTLPLLTALLLPQNATFTDSLNGRGLFVFMPDSTQFGVYFVRFIASDGTLADSELVRVNVTDVGNQPPAFVAVGPQMVNEGGFLQFAVRATDPDGDGFTLFLSDGPENSTFADSGNGGGLFTLIPSYYQAGLDTARIAAIDDGFPPAVGMLVVPITINDVNRPPQFDPVGPQSVLIGDSLLLRLRATDSTDPNGGSLILSAIRKPANSTFVDSGLGIGKFKFKPLASQVGVDSAIFLCADNENPPMTNVIKVMITVVAANQPPVLTQIGPRAVTEGDTLQFNISATDPDGPFITLFTSTLPRNAAFVDSGNGIGTFRFVPDYVQSGLISVKFYATDGIYTDNENVLIQIYNDPQAPIISVPDPITVMEGDSISFRISAVDPDSTIPHIDFDSIVRPLNSAFVDSGNGAASCKFKPVYVQAGVYDFRFIARDDDGMRDTGVVTITVLDAGNQFPFLTTIVRGSTVININDGLADTIIAKELDDLVFKVYDTDADSVVPILTATGVPPGATFADSLNYSGFFEWETTFDDSGVYPIRFTATDGSDALLEDYVDITVVIQNNNRPPLTMYLWQNWTEGHDEIWDRDTTINEGEVAVIGMEALDPDSVSPILRVSGLDNLPEPQVDTLLPLYANVEVVDSNNNMGTITFTPSFFQGRTAPYSFRVFAKDREDTTLYVQKDFEVTVVDRPQRPVLNPIVTPISVTEGDSVEFEISYYDPDSPFGTVFALTYSPTPANSGLTAVDYNTSEFYFYPWFDQSGSYDIRFQVMDPTFRFDTQTVRIEVVDAGPQPPILHVPFAPIDTVDLGSTFRSRIWAVDPEGDDIQLSALNLPANATFVDSLNGAGSFTFTPSSAQAAQTFSMSFVGADGVYADTVAAQIYVLEFVCGDVDKSGFIDIDDIVFIITYVFQSGPAPNPLISGDVNRTDCPDVMVDIDDITHLIGYVFLGGAPPNCTCPK
jgi:hypothetical protein